MEPKRVAIGTSKHIFTLHGVDERERPVLKRDLGRSQREPFFAKLAPIEIALEACAGSHHWGRVLTGLGHRVRLIPPQYVKPFVKRAKNDRNEAEAIYEAASRPTTRTVPVKTAEEQAGTIIIKYREMLVGQRTQAINALRGHATEFDAIAAKGCCNVPVLLAVLAANEAVPPAAKEMFARMGQHVADLDSKINTLDRQLLDLHKASPTSCRLAALPGVGSITAITMTLTVNAVNFETGQHFAAWLGLTPQERSSGGKQRFGRISKAGNEHLRRLLVVGTTAVVAYAKPGSESATPWLIRLLERRPRKATAAALANKMARVIRAKLAKVLTATAVGMPAEGMITRGEAYRRESVAA